MYVRQDVLYVRTFPKDNRSEGDRIVVDLDEDTLTDRYLVFTIEGATLALGSERASLSWNALLQLADLISIGAKSFGVKPTKSK